MSKYLPVPVATIYITDYTALTIHDPVYISFASTYFLSFLNDACLYNYIRTSFRLIFINVRPISVISYVSLKCMPKHD